MTHGVISEIGEDRFLSARANEDHWFPGYLTMGGGVTVVTEPATPGKPYNIMCLKQNIAWHDHCIIAAHN